MIRSAIFIFALTTQANAAEPPLWVLIGLDAHMGPTITYRDTARDADIHVDEGLPTFTTAAACQAALRHAIKKYAGSHMQRETTAVFCASIIQPGSKVNETQGQAVPHVLMRA